MRTDQIESRAVGAVKAIFTDTDNFSLHATENDRLAITDGTIRVLRENRLTSIKFEMAIQIKGTTINCERNKLTYSFDRKYLENVQNLNGIVFFVVHIGSSVQEDRVFYSIVAPHEAEELLEKKLQKSYSLSIHPLTDVSEFSRELHIAHEQYIRWLARPYMGDTPENISSITLHSTKPLDINTNRIVLDSDRGDRFVIDIEDSQGKKVKSYLRGMLKIESKPEETDISFSSGNIEYENVTKEQFLDEGRTRFNLSEVISLMVEENSLESDLTLRFVICTDAAFRFPDLLKAIRFINSVNTTNQLRLNKGSNEVTLKCSSNVVLEEHFAIDMLEEIDTLLDDLGINKNRIYISDLTGDLINRLRSMRSKLAQGELEQDRLNFEVPYSLSLGKGSVWFFEYVEGNETSFVSIFDIERLEPIFRNRNLSFVDVPENQWVPHIWIDSETIVHVLNYDFDNVWKWLETISDDERRRYLIGLVAGRFIKCADRNVAEKDFFLEKALALFDKLQEECPEIWVELNIIQCNRRKRELAVDEKKRLREIRSQSVSFDLRLLASGLLEDVEEFNYCLQQLSKEQLSVIQDHPIWDLFEQTMSMK